MARCFSGTVLLEGTNLSEGRGTSRPLEVLGAPDLPVLDMIGLMREEAGHWLRGASSGPVFFHLPQTSTKINFVLEFKFLPTSTPMSIIYLNHIA